jgi:hypothetical protein
VPVDAVKTRTLALAAALLLLPGCFKTVYRNLQPPNAPPVVETDANAQKKMPRGWQHFFFYGLIPDERTVDAAALCNGEEHVQQLDTRRTFLEGLVSAYGIYTPWNARVTCDHPHPP